MAIKKVLKILLQWDQALPLGKDVSLSLIAQISVR